MMRRTSFLALLLAAAAAHAQAADPLQIRLNVVDQNGVGAPAGQVVTKSDDTGVNIYIEVRKPAAA